MRPVYVDYLSLFIFHLFASVDRPAAETKVKFRIRDVKIKAWKDYEYIL